MNAQLDRARHRLDAVLEHVDVSADFLERIRASATCSILGLRLGPARPQHPQPCTCCRGQPKGDTWSAEPMALPDALVTLD